MPEEATEPVELLPEIPEKIRTWAVHVMVKFGEEKYDPTEHAKVFYIHGMPECFGVESSTETNRAKAYTALCEKAKKLIAKRRALPTDEEIKSMIRGHDKTIRYFRT